MKVVNEIEKNSSIDQLWNQLFHIIDDWNNQENFREDVLLQSTKQLVENVKQNQTKVSELIKQVTKELSEGEVMVREELLSSTAFLNNLFLFNSFEEINSQLDYAKNQSTELFSSPLNNLLKEEYPDTILSMLVKYIELRRNNRSLAVKKVKETFSNIQMNQKTFLNSFTNPIKNIFFPLNKYMI